MNSNFLHIFPLQLRINRARRRQITWCSIVSILSLTQKSYSPKKKQRNYRGMKPFYRFHRNFENERSKRYLDHSMNQLHLHTGFPTGHCHLWKSMMRMGLSVHSIERRKRPLQTGPRGDLPLKAKEGNALVSSSRIWPRWSHFRYWISGTGVWVVRKLC